MKISNLGAVLKTNFGFNNFSSFEWQQLIYALPSFWKKIIKDTDIADNLLIPNHYPMKKTLIGIEKLNSRQFTLSWYIGMSLHQYLRSILTNYLKLTAFTGNRYIFYHVVLRFSFNKKSWTMFFIEIKNFLRFENRLHLFVLSANFLTRQCSIYFMNAI